MSNLSIANSSASGTTATVSAWIKKIDAGTVAEGTFQFKTGSDVISFYINPVIKFRSSISGSTSNGYLEATRVIRDNAAWLHITAVIDTTNSTAGDRLRIYINGERLTSFSTATYPSQNYAFTPVSGGEFQMGKYSTTDSPVYLSHVHYCDGYAYNADTFGSTDSTTGEWKINTSPTVNYGSNGIFLKFANSASMGTDSSGNNRTMSISGSCLQTKDCPSNNFATLNPLVNTPADTGSLSNGSNTYTTSNYSYNTRSTLGMTSGKFYWEQKVNNATAVKVGLCTSQYDPSLDTDSSTAHYGGAGGGGVYVLMSNSTTTWQFTNSDTSKNTGSYTNAIASTSSSILMGAVDVDAGKLWVGVDGVWMNSGNPATGANAQITFTNSSPDALHIMASHGDNASRATSWNFGNGYFGTTAVSSAGSNASGIGIFEYNVPTGFTALSTKGLNL